MIISFAWTTQALIDGVKTVTRRMWKKSHAKKFYEGQIVDAYDKLPHAGGKKVATIRITRQPYVQVLEDMPDDHFEREGGTLYWKDKNDFIDAMGGIRQDYYVVEFELVEVFSG